LPIQHPSARSAPKTPIPNFDRVARIYPLAEYLTLGPLLQRTRTALLNQLGNPGHALVLGDGDGRFLTQLLLCYPACHALAVDTSAAMLARLRLRAHRRIPDATARLSTLHADALTLDPTTLTDHPDLITTHFFLDCLTQPELDRLVARLAPQLTPGGLWLLSDFTVPAHRILRPLAALYIRSLYLAFRILTGLRVTRLPDPQSALRRAGLRLLARRTLLFGLLYAELWQRE
jgi:SAM-dependent methyltransferase